MHFSNAAARRGRNLGPGKYVRPFTAPVSDSHQQLSHAELSLWNLSGREGLGSVRQSTCRHGKSNESLLEGHLVVRAVLHHFQHLVVHINC